jgi:hypothetical protein
MIINCYMSSACSAEEGLRENITSALALEDIDAEVHYYRLDDEKASKLGLSGSPSIRINDIELQPQKAAGFS